MMDDGPIFIPAGRNTSVASCVRSNKRFLVDSFDCIHRHRPAKSHLHGPGQTPAPWSITRADLDAFKASRQNGKQPAKTRTRKPAADPVEYF
jgi:hypothetical protein